MVGSSRRVGFVIVMVSLVMAGLVVGSASGGSVATASSGIHKIQHVVVIMT